MINIPDFVGHTVSIFGVGVEEEVGALKFRFTLKVINFQLPTNTMAPLINLSLFVALLSWLSYYLLSTPSGRVLFGPVGGFLFNNLGIEMVQNMTVAITMDTLKTDLVG